MLEDSIKWIPNKIKYVSQDQEESVAYPVCGSGKMALLVVILLSNKRYKLLTCSTIGMSLEVIVLRERSQTGKSTCCKFHPYKIQATLS